MALDLFLKVDGINGESTDSKHKDWIDVTSFGWGVENAQRAIPEGGGGAGRASFHNMRIVKVLDKSSPKLMLACASGQHIPHAQLQVCKPSAPRDLMLEFTLSEVFVTSFEEAEPQGGNRPEEQVSLTFGKIEMTYNRQGRAGQLAESIKAGWDITQNRGV